MRKHYTAKQKTKNVLEILKEERTIAQIASEHNIHPTQLYKWKYQAIEKMPGIFEGERKTSRRNRLNMSANSKICTPRSGS